MRLPRYSGRTAAAEGLSKGTSCWLVGLPSLGVFFVYTEGNARALLLNTILSGCWTDRKKLHVLRFLLLLGPTTTLHYYQPGILTQYILL